MAWQRETLAALVAQTETRIVGALDLVSPVLPVAVARAIARAVAGARHGLNGNIANSVRQIHPQTADAENLKLKAEADGVYQLLPTYARYVCLILGTSGTLVPVGATLKAPNGRRYKTVFEVLVNDPITVQAEDVGLAGNQEIGTYLEFDPPIPGVGLLAETTGGTDGTELEELEAYRARYLQARRAERLGGHESEYVTWAKKVPGVTRVWVYPREFGLGTVGIYFVRDGDPDIRPDEIEIARVSTEILKRRPALAQISGYLKAPALEPLNLTFSGVPSAQVRAKITLELQDLIWSQAEIGNTGGRGKITEEEIRGAARRATKSFTLVTTGDHPCPAERLFVLGTLTWNT